MQKRTIAIIGVVIAIIVIAIGGLYFTGFLNSNSETPFDNKFMSGEFQGEVIKNNISSSLAYSEWADSYEDKNLDIQYNMSSVKNGTFLIDLMSMQGLSSPETRNYGGVSWNIYYSQAVPTTNSTNASNISNNSADLMNVYICEAEQNGQTYMISVVASNNKTECDGSLYCDLFTKQVEPLLKSITLKEDSNAPYLYQTMNVSEKDFNDASKYLDQLKSGNVSVVNNSTSANGAPA